MIGLFDSGVGGLSVLRALKERIPALKSQYFADSAHMPYGPKSAEEIEQLVIAICDFLIAHGCEAIIMACNTSSALTLGKLQRRYDIPLLGVLQPGARAAVSLTQNGKVGVMATAGTVRSGAYEQAIKDIDQNVEVIAVACPLLAPLVENGFTTGAEVDKALAEYLAPLIHANVDTIVLGCTHYVFLADAIAALLPPNVSLVDPAFETVNDALPFVAHLRSHTLGSTDYYVSGSVSDFERVAGNLLGISPQGKKVVFHANDSALTVELE